MKPIDILRVQVSDMKRLSKFLLLPLFVGGLVGQRVQTGFNQTGAAHLQGPGVDTWGAYEMYVSGGPEWTSYRFKVVVPDGEVLRGLPPDIIIKDASVEAQGTQLGHYIWTANHWRLEMICIDETVRTQVSWEAEGRTPHPSKQTVYITVGRDSITFTVQR